MDLAGWMPLCNGLHELDQIDGLPVGLLTQRRNAQGARENLAQLEEIIGGSLESLQAIDLQLTHALSEDALLNKATLAGVGDEIKTLGQKIESRIEALEEVSALTR